jgi:hypothetical protein
VRQIVERTRGRIQGLAVQVSDDRLLIRGCDPSFHLKQLAIQGVCTVESKVLAMESDTGDVLLAELTIKMADSLHFKMIGGASNDPG